MEVTEHYTPEPSDLHLGYHYQKQTDGGGWVDAQVTTAEELTQALALLGEKKLRTAFLSPEELRKAGWDRAISLSPLKPIFKKGDLRVAVLSGILTEEGKPTRRISNIGVFTYMRQKHKKRAIYYYSSSAYSINELNTIEHYITNSHGIEM